MTLEPDDEQPLGADESRLQERVRAAHVLTEHLAQHLPADLAARTLVRGFQVEIDHADLWNPRRLRGRSGDGTRWQMDKRFAYAFDGQGEDARMRTYHYGTLMYEGVPTIEDA